MKLSYIVASVLVICALGNSARRTGLHCLSKHQGGINGIHSNLVTVLEASVRKNRPEGRGGYRFGLGAAQAEEGWKISMFLCHGYLMSKLQFLEVGV